jgi:hypothetical protein
MSLDKDQRLYMNWLSDLKNFVGEWTTTVFPTL